MESSPEQESPSEPVWLPVTRRRVKVRQLTPEERRQTLNRMPPALEQAKNAGGALMRAGAALLKGRSLRRSDEETARIQDLCKSNVCGRWDAERGRCAECGCYGAWKARLLTEKCPLGHWG